MLDAEASPALRAQDANVEVIVVVRGVVRLVKQRGRFVDVVAKCGAREGEREQPPAKVARDEDVLDTGAVVFESELHEQSVSVTPIHRSQITSTRSHSGMPNGSATASASHARNASFASSASA